MAITLLLALVVGVVLYLGYALIYPERF